MTRIKYHPVFRLLHVNPKSVIIITEGGERKERTKNKESSHKQKNTFKN